MAEEKWSLAVATGIKRRGAREHKTDFYIFDAVIWEADSRGNWLINNGRWQTLK